MFFKKKAVLMIHGFIGGIYDFDNFHNELQLHKNFDVFTFTLPAHEKFIVNDVKYKEWKDEATKQIEILIKNGYKEIYLVGHSMGGVLASMLASSYKEVKKLVLVAPAFRYFYFKDGKIDIKNVSETLKNMKEILTDKNNEILTSRIAKTPIPTVIEFMKLVKESQDYVNNIICPTLTINGQKDIIVPQEAAEHVYNNIKSKTNHLYHMSKINHDCFKKQKEVKKIIKDFLIKKPDNKKEIINI